MIGDNKISIVTVCLNAEKDIEKTILSILNQSSKDIEYIIKDGKSQDRTIDIVYSYKHKFEQKGIAYRIIRESDNGIYDAMNQAVNYCSNEWIIFMNAGDVFFNNYVIEDVFSRKYEKNVGIVYGHAKYKLAKGYEIIIESNLVLSSQVAICHQAIFMRRDLLKQYKFDTAYRIVADRELVFRVLKNKYLAYNVNAIVCVYARDGISALNYEVLGKEIYECNKKYEIVPNNYNCYVAIIKKYINRVCPILADIALCKKSMKRK